MNRISTHVLDTARGKTASGVPVRLESQDAHGKWILLGSSETDGDGRCGQLLSNEDLLREGVYRLTFDTARYFAASRQEALYPVVEITFQVRRGETQLHIPLLISPNGYTTYRGS